MGNTLNYNAAYTDFVSASNQAFFCNYIISSFFLDYDPLIMTKSENDNSKWKHEMILAY